MSITDATTNVSTTWTEYATVAFTAGTLSTITDMVTEVESKLKRGTLSTSTSPTLASVQRWLVRAKEELMAVKSFTFSRRFAYASLTAGDYRIALPPDFAGGSVRVKDLTNDCSLVFWPSGQYDTKFPDPSAETSDEPQICTIKNMELWLFPPATACTIELEYERSGDDNTTTDFSYLPEIERFRCCDYALYESCESLEDWEKAKWYLEKWGMGIERSRKANSRRKWKEMGFRAISNLEHYKARQYQSNRQ